MLLSTLSLPLFSISTLRNTHFLHTLSNKPIHITYSSINNVRHRRYWTKNLLLLPLKKFHHNKSVLSKSRLRRKPRINLTSVLSREQLDYMNTARVMVERTKLWKNRVKKLLVFFDPRDGSSDTYSSSLSTHFLISPEQLFLSPLSVVSFFLIFELIFEAKTFKVFNSQVKQRQKPVQKYKKRTNNNTSRLSQRRR